MNLASTIALTPLSFVFGIAVRIRNSLYRRGLWKSHDIGVPVISVGNLTTGGTGKTPMVQLLASQMAADGWRVCILTRGYARNSTGRVVVSDNSAVLSTVAEAGDEAFMLAENLRERAAVICDKNRIAAAGWAIANLGSELFILDDAFQHQKIQRTINIVLIDGTNAWGNGKLLPAGNLREPLAEVRRANCVVITRANESDSLERLRAQIEGIAGAIPIFTSHLKLTNIRSLDQNISSADLAARKTPVAAFCGIGNPKSFFKLLGDEGFNVAYSRVFRDHQSYDQTVIDKLVSDAFAAGAEAIITTAKDAVKLRSMNFSLPCFVVDTSMQIDRAEEFFRFLNQSIKPS
jgi:tetraacyldisaccharide 4'-kinase